MNKAKIILYGALVLLFIFNYHHFSQEPSTPFMDYPPEMYTSSNDSEQIRFTIHVNEDLETSEVTFSAWDSD